MREELIRDLERERSKHARWGLITHITANALAWIAVIASIAAALAAIINKENVELVAVLAAIPGFVTLSAGAFPLIERANWHYAYKIELDVLIRRLKYEGAEEKTISQEYTLLQKGMEEKYPQVRFELAKFGVKSPAAAGVR